eukprot:gene10043-20854_t
MLRNTRVPKYDGAISASNGRRFACVILMGLVQVVVIGSILGFGSEGRSKLGAAQVVSQREQLLETNAARLASPSNYHAPSTDVHSNGAEVLWPVLSPLPDAGKIKIWSVTLPKQPPMSNGAAVARTPQQRRDDVRIQLGRQRQTVGMTPQQVSSSSSNVGGDEGGVGSEEDDAVSDKMDWWERRHPPSTFHGMWDLTPATDWTNAYPIGNGALGGLVSGEPWQQRISLSEETLFNSAANIRARRLAEQKIEYAAREKRIRGSGATKDDLVWGFARKYKGETQYEDFMNVRKALLKGDMAGLATLELVTLPPPETQDRGWAENYIRELDLETGVAMARFTTKAADGITTLFHARESFVSAVDNVLVLRINCSTLPSGDGTRPRTRSSSSTNTAQGCANVRAKLNRPGSIVERIVAGGRRTLLMQRSNVEPNVMAYAACLRVVGATATETNAEGELLAGFDASDESITAVGDECRRRLDAAELVGLASLRERHVEDYATYFSRSRQAIKQFSCPSNSRIPVKERVVRLGQQCTLDNKAVATDAEAQVTGTLGAVSARNARIVDPDLLALTYSYARYLLISSSRPGTKPANLQGIWADGMNAPWNEMAAPIAPFIQDLSVDGKKIAKEWYNASGWVAHGFTDISGRAGSMAGPEWSLCVVC